MEQDNSERKPNLTFEKNTIPGMSANTKGNVSDRVKHDDHITTQHVLTTVNGEVNETKKIEN